VVVRLFRVLEQGYRVVQRDEARIRRVVRHKHGGEVEVGDTGPVVVATKGVAAGDLLDINLVELAILTDVEGGIGVLRQGLLIAEAGRPCKGGGDRCAVLRDGNMRVDHVGAVKGECLRDLQAARRVGVGERAGNAERGRGAGRYKECRGELAGERGLVGVERERQAELRGGFLVHQVKRLPVRAVPLLQNPRGDLGAAVGKGDPIQVVLDHDGACSGGLYRCGIGSAGA
jgi:hypothetical protein